MDAIDLFLLEHARTHSAALGTDAPLCVEDLLLRGLADDQLRTCPQPGLNSIAWVLWHVARTEDVGVNAVLAGRRQVLDEEDWLPRLGLSRRDIGTGMADEEVAGFGERVEVPALRAYRAAVGRRTQAVVQALTPGQLDEVLDAERLVRLPTEGAFAENATWVGTFWQGKRVGWFLTQVAGAHNTWHLAEAAVLKQLGGLGRGR